MMITETDETFGRYYQARQPDTRFIRLWDVAGASHADSYIVTPQELEYSWLRLGRRGARSLHL